MRPVDALGLVGLILAVAAMAALCVWGYAMLAYYCPRESYGLCYR